MGTRRTRRFWLCWALALAVTAVWTISASPVQTSQPVGGADHGSYVALTFDDGPWPGTTNTLLDGLAQRGVKATFFLVGEQVADRAETVRRMADEGHQIGLHTWHHVSLKGMTPDQITSQLDQTRAAIREIVGPVDLMLRPPYGFVDDTLRQWAKAPIICWSLDTEDWKDPTPSRITAEQKDPDSRHQRHDRHHAKSLRRSLDDAHFRQEHTHQCRRRRVNTENKAR